MPKKALLIGINYSATPQYKLNGCINDIMNIKNVLIDAYDYKAQNMTILRDDGGSSLLPTRQNIISSLKQIAGDNTCDEVWIHYSGHGTSVRDANADEKDGMDEAIVPSDFPTAGIISDDELFEIVKTIKCQAIICFDSCHSGTAIDLQYSFNYLNGSFSQTVNNNKSIAGNKNIFFFSGCRDDQTSADAFNGETRMGVGAFTDGLIKALRDNSHSVNIMKLYGDMCSTIIKSGYTQCPVLSCSSSSPNYKFERTNVVVKTNVVTQVVTQYVKVPVPTPTPAAPVAVKPAAAVAPLPIKRTVRPSSRPMQFM